MGTLWFCQMGPEELSPASACLAHSIRTSSEANGTPIAPQPRGWGGQDIASASRAAGVMLRNLLQRANALTWNRAKSSMRRVHSSDLLLQLTFKCDYRASIWHGLRFAVLMLRREVDCLRFKSRSNRLSSLYKKANDRGG